MEILLRPGLSRSPEVSSIAQELQRPRQEVVGWLVEFWAWALEQSPEGVIRRPATLPQTIDVLDYLRDVVGGDERFWRALLRVNWLSITHEEIAAPEILSWAKPGKATKRKKKNEEPGLFRTVEGLATPDLPPVADFGVFWIAYPRKEARKDALQAWQKIRPDLPLLEKMLVAIEAQRKSDQWQRGFVPYPATWLNGRRWEDERPQGSPGSIGRVHAGSGEDPYAGLETTIESQTAPVSYYPGGLLFPRQGENHERY